MYEFPCALITDRDLQTSSNKLYTSSHSLTLLSISEKSEGNPSSLRILPRGIFTHMSLTIHYTIDRAMSLKDSH
jgi:hypothetical protein